MKMSEALRAQATMMRESVPHMIQQVKDTCELIQASGAPLEVTAKANSINLKLSVFLSMGGMSHYLEIVDGFADLMEMSEKGDA